MGTETTTAPATEYDRSDPPEGFAVAAQRGDLAAIQAAADWLRERGNPPAGSHADDTYKPSDAELAYELEAIRGELEVQRARAQHLRRMLCLMQETNYRGYLRVRPRLCQTAVEQFLRCNGLLVNHVEQRAAHVRQEDGGLWRRIGSEETNLHRSVYIIHCDTDHTEEEATRQKLHDLLTAAFPSGTFVIEFGHYWYTETGWSGICALNLL